MAKKRTIRTIPRERTPMPEQGASERARNFAEVALGFTLENAMREAQRCLICPEQPCVKGCPVGVDIPGFIRKLGDKDFHGAYDTLTTANLLPAICGRVCPQESQCEGVCTVGETLEPVAIGRLERFVGDLAIAQGWVNVPYIEPTASGSASSARGPRASPAPPISPRRGAKSSFTRRSTSPAECCATAFPTFACPTA